MILSVLIVSRTIKKNLSYIKKNNIETLIIIHKDYITTMVKANYSNIINLTKTREKMLCIKCTNTITKIVLVKKKKAKKPNIKFNNKRKNKIYNR